MNADQISPFIVIGAFLRSSAAMVLFARPHLPAAKQEPSEVPPISHFVGFLLRAVYCLLPEAIGSSTSAALIHPWNRQPDLLVRPNSPCHYTMRILIDACQTTEFIKCVVVGR